MKTRLAWASLVLPLALACGSGGSADDGGLPDGTVADTGAQDSGTTKDSGAQDSGSAQDSGAQDSGMPDSGVQDSGTPPKCASANDCRKFSSYCNGTVLKPCVCYGLHQQQSNPVCDGTMVTCIIDPCQNKTVGCDAGACVIQ